jgi:hypothetical protein
MAEKYRVCNSLFAEIERFKLSIDGGDFRFCAKSGLIEELV